eukprot:7031778-Prymnesium_polylepis.1
MRAAVRGVSRPVGSLVGRPPQSNRAPPPTACATCASSVAGAAGSAIGPSEVAASIGSPMRSASTCARAA